MEQGWITELARRLVGMDTCNPPGREQECALHLAAILEEVGFGVELHPLAPGRPNLVAFLPGGDEPPLCLSGHLDTVPLGRAPWSFEPLAGLVEGGRLLGRGASDMKGGVAALVGAARELARQKRRRSGVLVVLSAGEETGCQGVEFLARRGLLPPACGALLVAEPTSNYPMLGHKGATWFTVQARGRSAHGSMPQLGENAIEKAARAVVRLGQFDFGTEPHPHMGRPTLNVGTISGGVKTNMVPDQASFTVDMRTLPGQDPGELLAAIARHLGPEVELEPGVQAGAVWTPPDHPWARQVMELMARVLGREISPRGLSYFTDAPTLAAAMGDPPVIILGPGEPGQAHQTDEFCHLDKIGQAAEVYLEIGRAWLGG